jgi:hypothetical protein
MALDDISDPIVINLQDSETDDKESDQEDSDFTGSGACTLTTTLTMMAIPRKLLRRISAKQKGEVYTLIY